MGNKLFKQFILLPPRCGMHNNYLNKKKMSCAEIKYVRWGILPLMFLLMNQNFIVNYRYEWYTVVYQRPTTILTCILYKTLIIFFLLVFNKLCYLRCWTMFTHNVLICPIYRPQSAPAKNILKICGTSWSPKTNFTIYWFSKVNRW